MRILYKWLICSWLHNDWRCYPEVWGRGLKGPWHCSNCHPCGEDLEDLFVNLRQGKTL